MLGILQEKCGAKAAKFACFGLELIILWDSLFLHARQLMRLSSMPIGLAQSSKRLENRTQPFLRNEKFCPTNVQF